MTCGEFKRDAAALTLRQLARRQDEAIGVHAQQCASCGRWLQEQRSLAVSLQTLQARTAGFEASPAAEQVLLQAFRQRQATTATFVGWPERDTAETHRPFLKSLMVYASAPFALRLSRFFEVGAYVAVTAAILVGMFLGVRLLQHSSRTVLVRQTVPDSTGPSKQKPVAAVQLNSPQVSSMGEQARVAGRSRLQSMRHALGRIAAGESAEEGFQTDAEDGYIALMFCDPLSCAADSQVVRMELPASASLGGQSSHPQIADVVVGYDGVVRAVRIVN
jgi:hypothetical protein